MRKFLAISAVALAAVSAVADNGIITRWYENDSVYGTALITNSAAGKARLVINEVAASNLTATSSTAPAATIGAATVTQRLVTAVSAQTLTNVATISAAAPVVVVISSVASNNPVLPTATVAGQWLTIIASSSLTNVLTIHDTAYLAGDITLGANDSLTLVANAASNFVEVSRSNN